ncbi:MAG: ankyrin repeat domain-containing protein [Betaproteobacteria bacterium]|nr:ankyrin repeat domain-containing protein [Betaproteobacteria bacterium]
MNDGNTAEVRRLLDRGLDVNTSDANGDTLLMLATRKHERELAGMLVSRKADLARRNRYGDNALMMASLIGDLLLVKAFIEAGAAVNQAGWSALHYAAFGGSAPVVTYLIGKGAEKNSVAPNGYTPLMLAARDGQVEAAKALLFEDADADFRNSAGETAMIVAERRKKPEVIELLKRAGARR